MNLRNRKTRETGYYLHTHRDSKTGVLKIAVLKDGVPFSEFKPHEPIYDYDSLAGVNEDWEDYKPDEPQIKDEKARKVFREWAEFFGAERFRVTHLFRSGKKGTTIIRSTDLTTEPSIELPGYIGEDSEIHTKIELCGEEKE